MLKRFVYLGFGVLMMLGVGCEQGELFVNQGAEQIGNAAQDAVREKLGVDINEKGASLSDTKTGRSFSVGEAVEIPTTFPNDVPIYPEATLTSVSVTDPGRTAALILNTTDSKEAIRTWYANAATTGGWTEEGSYEQLDNVLLSFSRPENGEMAKLTVTIQSPDLQKRITVIIARQGVKADE